VDEAGETLQPFVESKSLGYGSRTKKVYGKKAKGLVRVALYPSRYEEWVDLRNGRKVFLRPVKETDGPLLVELFEEMSVLSVRLRFLSPLHHLPEQLVYRFTHVDYRKDFGLAALINENSGPIIGVVRYAYDPQSEMLELAVAVRDDWQRNGLGSRLLIRVVKVSTEHGYSRFGAQ
jgi:acetyltransferase